jgi:hypothetical protein
MKLTRDRLKQIIKEELNSLLKEGVSDVFAKDFIDARHPGLFDAGIKQLQQAKQNGEDYAKVNISGMTFIMRAGEPGAAFQYVGNKPGEYVEGPKVVRFSLEAMDQKGDAFLKQLAAGKNQFYQDMAAKMGKQLQKVY